MQKRNQAKQSRRAMTKKPSVKTVKVKPKNQPNKKVAKKQSAKTAKTKESAVSKIFKTTDGNLGGKPKIKKPRSVATVKQRKKDGAVAVVKIYSKEGKEEKIGKDFIPNLELTPDKHPSLTKTSIVGRQVIIGIKDGESFKPIMTRDLEATNDKLTRKELKVILKEANNDTKQHRKTYNRKIKKWRKSFKK